VWNQTLEEGPSPVFSEDPKTEHEFALRDYPHMECLDRDANREDEYIGFTRSSSPHGALQPAKAQTQYAPLHGTHMPTTVNPIDLQLDLVQAPSCTGFASTSSSLYGALQPAATTSGPLQPFAAQISPSNDLDEATLKAAKLLASRYMMDVDPYRRVSQPWAAELLDTAGAALRGSGESGGELLYFASTSFKSDVTTQRYC
jgi:hypothetical protein